MRKRKAFTLVELLVVIGIIALLISLLLPALNKARDSAMRIACAANVRSLALFTLMYATDNHNTLMSNGANNTMIYGSQGNAPVTTNSSLGTFFAYYMKVSNANTPSQNSTLQPYYDTYYNLRFHTPRTLICPAANPFANYYDLGYAYYTGSCLPVQAEADGSIRPYPLTLTKLRYWGTVQRSNHTPIPGGLPALWGDKCQWKTVGNFGSPAETGHWNVRKGIPAGGNVARIDGSVSWFPFSSPPGNPYSYYDNGSGGGGTTYTSAKDSFVIPSGGWTGQGAIFPSNAIFIRNDGYNDSMALITNFGSGYTLIMGSNALNQIPLP